MLCSRQMPQVVGAVGRIEVQCLPITPSILRQLRALWSRRAHDYDVILSWAACCTAFFGFFRIGELTEQSTRSCNGVAVSHVSVDSRENPSMVKIHLRRSKTDQFGRGISIYLGTTGDELCPVSALMAYLAVRGGALVSWTRPLPSPALDVLHHQRGEGRVWPLLHGLLGQYRNVGITNESSVVT